LLIRPFVDEGLGNSSYLVASTGTGLAAVIDPQRDADRYRQVADGLGLRVSYALDTHLHADFVSGARELAAKGSGEIRIGASAGARLDFDYLPLAEGDELSLGDVSIGVLTTPGHTPEHISFSMLPAGSAAPDSIFTGGALIVAGAARTDLLGHDLAEPLARQLYRTLHHKLLRFPDEVRIFPTHGGGSFCAAPTSKERTTTIGRERRTNRLAQAPSEEQFVRAALSGLPSYPAYYRHMRDLNRRGARILGGVPALEAVSPRGVRQSVENGAAVIDIRSPREFASGHVPGSYGIPLASSVSTWAGWVVPFGSTVILVADDPAGREEAARQLIRIGYDDLRGYLDGGIGAWRSAGLPTAHAPMIDIRMLDTRMRSGNPPLVIDVRFDPEWRAGHLPEALHLEPGRIPAEAAGRVPRDRPIVVHCASGNRATVGLSLLERLGYRDLTVLDTGFGPWRDAGYKVVEEAA
jgi:rhodanese-related sulfurtransferase/glyoxylase-like metal-dependent hydrolase (beta-lactamase superfamily II)